MDKIKDVGCEPPTPLAGETWWREWPLARISSDRIPYLGYLVIGVFGPPMGLDLAKSSRDLSFMEPASVLQALAKFVVTKISRPKMSWQLAEKRLPVPRMLPLSMGQLSHVAEE